jgi:hypothetical protein
VSDVATFKVGPYLVTRTSKLGLWLVTCDSLFEMGMLFLRVQEFYESCNDDFRGKPFTILDYMRWYSETQSEEKSFTYFSDYEGFNLNSDTLELALQTVLDPNKYDLMMTQIATEIKARQGGKFYLIGAQATATSVLAHETAHGMFYLLPDYRAKMTALVEKLPEREEMFDYFLKDGYADHVMVDETQAYLATGLFQDLLHLEHIRHPFMQVFAAYKSKLNKQPRKRTVKPKEEVNERT